MKINLDKLLYNPNTNPLTVQFALQTRFEVETTPRNEPLFNWQMLCKINGKLKLIIRYGWSERKEQWYFEPLSKRTLQGWPFFRDGWLQGRFNIIEKQ